MKRRNFLQVAAVAAGARAQSPGARVEVLAAEPAGRIAPEIYGHFVEHLGGVVYDGIWVGEGSRIPNTGGIRTALVDALKKTKPSVIRWPGGCFADSYNWRDGIGPRASRPRRPNFWIDAREWPSGAPDGPWKYDPNAFGTQEFLRFCELCGAQPYLAANLRSLTARDFYEWVDYVNAPAGSTTLAEQRGQHGHRDPYNVRYWGIGNESWGCGGGFKPEQYAVEFRRFAEWAPRFGVPLTYIGSGPNGGDISWTRGFFQELSEKGGFGRLWGWALHHYSWNVSAGRTNDWFQGKGAAVNYPAAEWYELLAQADKMEGLIEHHWSAMGEYDRQHRVKLVVDEWGAWFKPGSELHPSHLLGQQSTMRDAVLASTTLDTFHRHASKVAMANIAQLVNCLQALFFAHEDKFALTPTYHVFEMYSAHQGAESLRTLVSAPLDHQVRGVSASASRNGAAMTLTVTNTHAESPRDVEIVVRGAQARVTGARLLAAPSIQTVNTFENPRAIEPKAMAAPAVRGGVMVVQMPPASVARLDVTLS